MVYVASRAIGVAGRGRESASGVDAGQGPAKSRFRRSEADLNRPQAS